MENKASKEGETKKKKGRKQLVKPLLAANNRLDDGYSGQALALPMLLAFSVFLSSIWILARLVHVLAFIENHWFFSAFQSRL